MTDSKMKYKVSVNILTPRDDRDYHDTKEIYSQVVDEIDLLSVIKAVNSVESDKRDLKQALNTP